MVLGLRSGVWALGIRAGDDVGANEREREREGERERGRGRGRGRGSAFDAEGSFACFIVLWVQLVCSAAV